MEEIYVQAVEEKKKEVPTMTIAPFKSALDQGLKENMHFIGKLDDFAPGKSFEDLTSEHMDVCIRSIFKQSADTEVNHSVLEIALQGAKVDLTIEDPNARMLEFANDVFIRVEGVGYGDFKRSPRTGGCYGQALGVHPWFG